MFERILFGLIGMALGIAMMVYAHKIVDNFTGPIRLAEKYLGGAGTYTFIRYLGAFLAIISMLIMFGIAGNVYNDVMKGIRGVSGY